MNTKIQNINLKKITERGRLWFCFFVCVEVKHPSQQFFSHVGTEPPLPGYYQDFWRVKCLAQGHNTAEVGFELPTSRSGVRTIIVTKIKVIEKQ